MDADNKAAAQSKIEEALTSLRPFLEEDGGDITYVDINDQDIVLVELHGACSSCSMSPMTLRAGVEDAIRKVVPAIKGVKAVNISDTVLS